MVYGFWSPIWHQCYRGSEEELAETLEMLECMGELEEVNRRGGEGTEFEGMTCLMVAATLGHEGVVELLLAQPGLRVNEVDQEGWTALLLAFQHDRGGVARRILAHPGQQGLEGRSAGGESPLMWALSMGKVGIVEELVKVPGIDLET